MIRFASSTQMEHLHRKQHLKYHNITRCFLPIVVNHIFGFVLHLISLLKFLIFGHHWKWCRNQF